MTTKINKFRSGLERNFNTLFGKLIQGYETERLEYTLTHTYTPDWTIAPNVYMETKGIWDSADRTKIAAVLREHPEITIVMVFQKPFMTISKSSSTTYAAWCNKKKIPWFEAADRFGIEKFIKGVIKS